MFENHSLSQCSDLKRINGNVCDINSHYSSMQNLLHLISSAILLKHKRQNIIFILDSLSYFIQNMKLEIKLDDAMWSQELSGLHTLNLSIEYITYLLWPTPLETNRIYDVQSQTVPCLQISITVEATEI